LIFSFQFDIFDPIHLSLEVSKEKFNYLTHFFIKLSFVPANGLFIFLSLLIYSPQGEYIKRKSKVIMTKNYCASKKIKP